MSGIKLWGLLFGAVLVTHLAFLTMPAGIDGAWTVMAGAETLATNGFDYPALLDQPGFMDGGPSTHALSIVTLMTAVVLAALGTGTASLVTLHLLHVGLGATALWFTLKLSRTVLPPVWSWWVVLATAATPIVFTQMGMIYLETPLLAASMAALWYAANGRLVPASACALLAVVVKPSGLAIAISILFVSLLFNRSTILQASMLAAASIALVAAFSVQRGSVGTAFDVEQIFRFWRSHARFLAVSPMTLALLFGHAGSTAWWVRRQTGASRALDYVMVFPWLFLGQHSAGPIFGLSTNLLPRYWAVIVPLMLISTAAWLRENSSQQIRRVVAVGYLVAAAVGLAGYLGPGATVPDFILAERSPTYRHLLFLEKSALEQLIESEATILTTGDGAFRLEYPAAGYVATPHRGHMTVPSEVVLDGLPEHVIFIERDGPERHTVRADQLGPGWDIEKRTLRNGRFEIRIVEATRS